MATALQSQLSLLGGMYTFSDFYDQRAVAYPDRLAAPLGIGKRLPDLFQAMQTRQEITVRMKNVLTWIPSPYGSVPYGNELATRDVTLSDFLAGGAGLVGQEGNFARIFDLDNPGE